MPRSVNIVLSPTIAAPLFVYLFMTVLAVLGNAIYIFSYTVIETMTTSSTAYFTLWVMTSSPNSGSTSQRLWAWLSDYSSNFCSSDWTLYQAAQAWAIITTILTGLALLVVIGMLILQQQVTIAKASMIGALFSVLIFVSSWIAFATQVAIGGRSCKNVTYKELPGYQLGPSAFMYLGTAVLSVVTLLCHVLTLKATKVARPEPQPAAREMSPVAQDVRNYGYSSQNLVAVPKTDTTGTKVFAQNHSPIRNELPLPEGSDWVLDESGLYWSDTKKLFFDRASGQFYDPSSDKWYNPEQNIWYKL